MLNLFKIRDCWTSLRYWQKGAIIGAGFHLSLISLIFIIAFIFVPTTPPPGTGDMGTLLQWILYGFYFFLEIIPFYVLHLTTGIDVSLLETFSNLRTAWMWALYMMYATAIYAFIGLGLSKAIQFHKTRDRGNNDKGKQ